MRGRTRSSVSCGSGLTDALYQSRTLTAGPHVGGRSVWCLRNRISGGKPACAWTQRDAPFIGLAVFRLAAPARVVPFYSTVGSEILVLVVGGLSGFAYWLVMTLGARPLRILESAGRGREVDETIAVPSQAGGGA